MVRSRAIVSTINSSVNHRWCICVICAEIYAMAATHWKVPSVKLNCGSTNRSW